MTDADRLYARVAELYPDAGLLGECQRCRGTGIDYNPGTGSAYTCPPCMGVGKLLPPPEVRLGRLVRTTGGVSELYKAGDGYWYCKLIDSDPHTQGPDPESALCQALIAAKEEA